MSLVGKAVVVTGAASGIGRATAVLLASQGASVVVAGRSALRGAEVVDQICSGGRHSSGSAIFHQVDVSKGLAEMQRLVHACHDTFGRLDGLFNNAGIVECSDAHGCGGGDDEGLSQLWGGADTMMQTNVLSCIWAVQAAVPLMRSGGVFVNNSSVAAGSSLGSGTTSPLCVSHPAQQLLSNTRLRLPC